MAGQESIESKIQLLVEGNAHKNFFGALVSHLAYEAVQVRSFGGVNDLGRFLRAFVNEPELREQVRSLGIVRDAEASAADAFKSVQSSMNPVGLHPPDDPEVPSRGTPSVSVPILPGGGSPGMFETLLCRTFEGSQEDNCFNSFFECIEKAGVGEIKRPDKARAWAYLTTKPDPHHSVGYAATKGYWGELDQPAFSVVRDFLKKLRPKDAAGKK